MNKNWILIWIVLNKYIKRNKRGIYLKNGFQALNYIIDLMIISLASININRYLNNEMNLSIKNVQINLLKIMITWQDFLQMICWKTLRSVGSKKIDCCGI